VVAEPLPRLDRRHRRRLETIEQVLDVAAAVMVEQGVAGLSLGEVARRMGIRPPSLYVYYDSKNALYDAIFARGWRELTAYMEPLHRRHIDETTDLQTYLQSSADTFVRWAVEHPAYTQLMAWRPVPNYEPSADAYAPAVEMFEEARAAFAELHARGLFRHDVAVDEALDMWTVLISGVVTQQLANAPHESFDAGRYTSRLPELVAMYVSHFGAPAAKKTERRKSDADAG
jgi:AcrR family transcriptional regulator